MELPAFLLASLLIILIPGPNVLVIVSTSLVHGRWRGLQTVAGTSAAMIIQMLIAGAATQGLLDVIGIALSWLKWLGVVYLVYLGVQHLMPRENQSGANASSAVGSFSRGFWVSLTNPKTILFFSAFLPQFVSNAENYAEQIVVLSALFWSLAILLDSAYALFATAIRGRMADPRFVRIGRRLGGGFFIGAGALLALSHQRQ